MKEYSVVGKRVLDIHGIAKATGAAQYTDDLVLPRMLYGKILRSPLPHARIINIDTSKAEKLPGVKAIITGKDVPGTKLGLYRRSADQYPIASDKVRYIGDEVAAVAAVDEDIAAEALDLIEVNYEELPAVFDVIEAMKEDAPQIHDVDRNISHRTSMDFGNVDEGFRQADYIREDRFTNGAQIHCQLEPHVALASFDPSGKLTMWLPNMSPFIKRRLLSRVLNMPESNIRICRSYIGGAFGGKSMLFSLDFSAALLSIRTGRPVKITYTREEVFTCVQKRHPFIVELKTGVKKDGTLIARECRAIANNGAYNYTGPLAIYLCCSSLFKTYRCPNIRYEGVCVYTNRMPSSAMRGHGKISMRFADDSQLDMIAEELGIDPVEIRLKNARQRGDVLPDRTEVISCGLSECIQKTVESSSWQEKRSKLPPNRGIGIGCTHGQTAQNTGPLSSSAAFIKFNEDGKVNLLTGAIDNGQHTETMLAQIAAEELGVPLEYIRVTAGDSETTPTDVGSFLMALTFVTGHAVKAAAADAKRQLLEIAAERMGAKVAELEAREGRIYLRENPDKGMSFAEVVMAGLIKGIPVLGKGYYMPKTEYLNIWTGIGKSLPTYSYGAQVTEVEVDTETGQVKLAETSGAVDCGFAINPMDVEGQIESCAVMSQGWTLSEQFFYDQGQMLNPSFLEYKPPLAVNTPKIKPIIVESIDPEGPFGAKDAGEVLIHTGPAAVANAIYNAIGVRIKDLPITPEKILKALREKEGRGT
jgi:4-hydroxybenzoyl-CoA reductase subunit alpha